MHSILTMNLTLSQLFWPPTITTVDRLRNDRLRPCFGSQQVNLRPQVELSTWDKRICARQLDHNLQIKHRTLKQLICKKIQWPNLGLVRAPHAALWRVCYHQSVVYLTLTRQNLHPNDPNMMLMFFVACDQPVIITLMRLVRFVYPVGKKTSLLGLFLEVSLTTASLWHGGHRAVLFLCVSHQKKNEFALHVTGMPKAWNSTRMIRMLTVRPPSVGNFNKLSRWYEHPLVGLNQAGMGHEWCKREEWGKLVNHWTCFPGTASEAERRDANKQLIWALNLSRLKEAHLYNPIHIRARATDAEPISGSRFQLHFLPKTFMEFRPWCLCFQSYILVVLVVVVSSSSGSWHTTYWTPCRFVRFFQFSHVHSSSHGFCWL